MLLIGGRSGAGKSRVGEELHHLLFETQVGHGYIEGDYLDMAYPPPWAHRLAERNLQAVWRNYQALGHHRLIYTNTVSVLVSDDLAAAIDGPVQVTGVLLTADDATTASRLAQREVGSALEVHLQRSNEKARELEGSCPAWVHRVATDDRTVTDIAGEVLSLTSWASD
jgi:cytidylate kinase